MFNLNTKKMVKIEAIAHKKSKLETGKIYEVQPEIAKILIDKKFAKDPNAKTERKPRKSSKES